MRLPSFWRSQSLRSVPSRRSRLGSGSFRPHVEEMERRDLLSTVGVYNLLAANQNITQDRNLNNPYVDGFALRYTWNFLEPVRGQYNWSFVDQQINSLPAGKAFSLSVTAGYGTLHDGIFDRGTPLWVYQAGAVPFNFTDPNTGAAAQIPLPWDPVFQNAWTQFIGALGAHYGSNPRLTHVKITGVNTDSAETTLPAAPAADPTEWRDVGYTRPRMEAAWEGIATTFSHAFQGKQIAMMANPAGFPATDTNGNIIVGSTGHDTKIIDDLINYGQQNYHANFIVQNNGLSDYWVYSKVATAPSPVGKGYQMLWFVTNDATYKMNNGIKIDPATELQNAVNKGVQNGAQFLEIYQVDINNPALQGVIASAQAQLHGHAEPAAGQSGSGYVPKVVGNTASQDMILATALNAEGHDQSRFSVTGTDANAAADSSRVHFGLAPHGLDGDEEMVAAFAGLDV